MADWAQKRFWKSTSVSEDVQGFTVFLDERTLKTPAKATLILPTRAMAQAIAKEWDDQEDGIDPNTMPVTRAANASIDKVAVQHAEVADMIAGYGETDLLCYRAESPAELIDRQEAAWGPLLDWAKSEFDAPLNVTSGIVPVDQPSSSLERLSKIVHAFDPFALTAVHDLVSISGSLVIGLAAIHEVAEIEALWKTSRIDELWQEEQWGVDDEASELADSKLRSFAYAKQFFDLNAR